MSYFSSRYAFSIFKFKIRLTFRPWLREKNLVCDGRHLNSALYSSKSDTPVIELSSYPLDRIRNFSIIAHIDHGKSTLADRMLELTGAINKDSTNKQVLDKLQVEKERGITVKAQTVSITYNYKGKDYLLNLIDTPGHVDFAYEVSRSLSACQGAVLLIDANQGVQAQTVANFYLAFSSDLHILPVLNKIDLPNAQPEKVKEQLLTLFDIDPDGVIAISAKMGTGVTNLIEKIIDDVPSPLEKCNTNAPLRALLFDSWFDKYKGAVCMIWIVDGTIKKGDYITSAHTGKIYEVKTLGILTPEELSVKELYSGQVGFFTANIRSTKETQLGDTFFHRDKITEPLAEITPAKPMVFAGVYPLDQSEYHALSSAIERLTLNDASISVTPESSSALGQGWRLGFLGLLHMDVFSQRMDNEHGAQVVFTTPSVPYKVHIHGEKVIKRYGGKEVIINNPSNWPEVPNIVETFEPFVLGTIITPDCYLGSILSLCQDRRGIQQSIQNVDESRIIIQYKLPLNEVVVDFYDKLKSCSSGYATFDYEDLGYEESSLVKLNVMLNGNVIEELSSIIHYSRAQQFGRSVCLKLCETIPKQLFQISVQAAVGGKILARENIKPYRKDVLAKCYGGDITRKMKLLKRQSEGKKKMKMYGNIEVPREAFISILKR